MARHVQEQNTAEGGKMEAVNTVKPVGGCVTGPSATGLMMKPTCSPGAVGAAAVANIPDSW